MVFGLLLALHSGSAPDSAQENIWNNGIEPGSAMYKASTLPTIPLLQTLGLFLNKTLGSFWAYCFTVCQLICFILLMCFYIIFKMCWYCYSCAVIYIFLFLHSLPRFFPPFLQDLSTPLKERPFITKVIDAHLRKYYTNVKQNLRALFILPARNIVMIFTGSFLVVFVFSVSLY